jgi:hypothetical protein
MSREGKLELTEEPRLVTTVPERIPEGRTDRCAQIPPGEAFADRPERFGRETQRCPAHRFPPSSFHPLAFSAIQL